MKQLLSMPLFIIILAYSAYASYLDSKMFLNTSNQFLIKANALLDDEVSVVLDSATLEDVAAFFTERLGITFYVIANIKDRKVEVVNENIKVSDLIEEISKQTHCFFVLRPGYILISDKAQFLLRPQFEVNIENLQKLEKYINSTGAAIFISSDKILASLTYEGMIKFREYLLETPIVAEVIRTDMLIPSKLF